VSVIGFAEPETSGALTTADRAAALASGVRMRGARHDIDWLYTGMDVFVLASHREGVPRAAMEAAAMGVPIVATDVRGCRQVVEHGVTGLLVPVRAPQALAAAVRHLVVDPTLRAEMGRAARARALRLFDQQRCIDVSLATYERALHARGLPAPAAAHGIRR
ncbi:MAG: glycosyltransferase, partial [Microthrixaceae bacterium]